MTAIVPFLKDQAFDHNDIEAMSLALNEVCQALRVGKDIKARETIAVRIIMLAQRGQRDPVKLCDQLIAEANGGSPRITL